MANGTGTIETIKELLREETAIPTKTALTLTLEMLLELHKAVIQQGYVVKANTALIELNKKKYEALERKSIVLWMERHPKLTVFLATLIVVLSTVIDLREVISKVLGL